MKKLRAYKGIKYLPTIGSFQYGGQSYKSAAYLVTHLPFLTDDDHAALMRLKAEPYEDVQTLEEVIESAYEEWRDGYSRTGYKELISKRIRAAFPHIDEEEA